MLNNCDYNSKDFCIFDDESEGKNYDIYIQITIYIFK